MNISLTAAEHAVQSLKSQLQIPLELPHMVGMQLWKHGPNIPIEIACQVTIFIAPTDCEIGAGTTFHDALNDVQHKITARSPKPPPDEPIIAEV